MNAKTATVLALLLFLLVVPGASLFAADDLQTLIQQYKADDRGPYEGIRWFCEDGTVIPARANCPAPGGIQHAVHKAAVRALAAEKGIYLGQILAGASFEAVWDAGNRNSLLKQYLLEKYLQSVDDGWILRKAQYYRGAVQMEDEEAWGRKFLMWVLARDAVLEQQFFLVHQAFRGIPHRKTDDRWQRIRSLSKEIAEAYPSFADLRVKLHGHPEAGDIEKVRAFMTQHQGTLPPETASGMARLIDDLAAAFSPAQAQGLASYLPRFGDGTPIKTGLQRILSIQVSPDQLSKDDGAALRDRCEAMAELLLTIRERITAVRSPAVRLDLMDLSTDLAVLLYTDIQAWRVDSTRDAIRKNTVLATAAAGCGFMELWEWAEVSSGLEVPDAQARIRLDGLTARADTFRRMVEWGTGMVRAVYGPEISLFSEFEPLAGGFFDDRIRSSLLLPMGDAAGRLEDAVVGITGLSNQVMGAADPGDFRGINPGYARGPLVVVTGDVRQVRFDSTSVYILPGVPPDIRPVAGIAAVSEGNLVSHVQLLARNLGIPNAVISTAALASLAPYSGLEVFYAVSPGGTVVLKPAADMTDAERRLVEKQARRDDRVLVPTDKMMLERTDLFSLKDLRAFDSGRICGPKAANLGQLKRLFPEHVADGLVIPFGVFRDHMDQPMPGTGGTYWAFLRDTFQRTDEAGILARLETLRDAIKTMPFLPGFQSALAARFRQEFGVDMGALPVFVRSDTNMEDLKEFTGAGLNLTVFNVRDADRIRQGIRDVWASPFTERSYLWRQKFMRNPENVYPSILILPTVAVDASGVVITTGVTSGDPNDLTAAFSKGPGGAVEGQAAETWLLKPGGVNRLLSPSREPGYNILPPSGGGRKGYRDFNRRIVSPADLDQLRSFAGKIQTRLSGSPGIEGGGPFDIELGFKDGKIWLFQVRPYVENRQAQASAYLRGLDPRIQGDMPVSLD